MIDGMAEIGLKLKGLRVWRNLNALPNLVRELVSQEMKNDGSYLVNLHCLIELAGMICP